MSDIPHIQLPALGIEIQDFGRVSCWKHLRQKVLTFNAWRNGAVTMDNLEFEQLLQLAAGWSPPNSSERERKFVKWVTWKDFMDTWLAVREEFLSREQWGSPLVFAEQVYQTFGIKGPPADITYEELHAAIDAAEDDKARELLADVDVG